MEKEEFQRSSESLCLKQDTKFDLNTLLGFRLIRLSASLGALAEKESQSTASLSLPEYRILTALAIFEPIGVVSLQKKMRIDKGWISRTLSRLVAKDLATSEVHVQDGRKIIFKVTPKGKGLADELIQRAVTRQQYILDGVTGDELKILMSTLQKIQENVDREISN